MTAEEVVDRVRAQVGEQSVAENHGMRLKQALIMPRRISVIFRRVELGQLRDEMLEVWLVGEEKSEDGYKIIMRDDGSQFGLASSGFPADKCPVLVGWYGSLLSAFLGM